LVGKFEGIAQVLILQLSYLLSSTLHSVCCLYPHIYKNELAQVASHALSQGNV